MNGRANIRNMHTTAMAAIQPRSSDNANIFPALSKKSCSGISALLIASQEDKIVGADEVGVFSKDSAYPDHTPVI